MAFNCKLNRNITLNEDSSEIGCGSTELTSGGIEKRIYIYNIDDIDNLKFQNDSRFDDNLIIETIITSASYFYVDCSSVTYNEDSKGNRHIHTLTAVLANTQPITEDALSDAAQHRYLVAFRQDGFDEYRVFGWKEGAGLNYMMDIDETQNIYTITISDESEYPLMACDADNFNLAEKIFSPIFKPLYDIAYCEEIGGKNNGYCIASYVVKVNSAGQALDANNMLTIYSGLPQDAYKYENVSGSGGYHIIDTYADSASFDGNPVKVFDPMLCPIDAEGTITVSPQTVKLNSSTTQAELTLTSDNPWKVVNSSPIVTVSPSSGNGNATIYLVSNGTGGGDTIVFQNRSTYERVNVAVNNYLIKIGTQYYFPNTQMTFFLYPVVTGGSCDYNYSVSPTGLTLSKQSDNSLKCTMRQPYAQRTWTITLTHADDPTERKIVSVTVRSAEDAPVWSLMNSYCEDI